MRRTLGPPDFFNGLGEETKRLAGTLDVGVYLSGSRTGTGGVRGTKTSKSEKTLLFFFLWSKNVTREKGGSPRREKKQNEQQDGFGNSIDAAKEEYLINQSANQSTNQPNSTIVQ